MATLPQLHAAQDDVGDYAEKNLDAIRHPKRLFTDAEIDAFNDAAEAMPRAGTEKAQKPEERA